MDIKCQGTNLPKTIVVWEKKISFWFQGSNIRKKMFLNEKSAQTVTYWSSPSTDTVNKAAVVQVTQLHVPLYEDYKHCGPMLKIQKWYEY